MPGVHRSPHADTLSGQACLRHHRFGVRGSLRRLVAVHLPRARRRRRAPSRRRHRRRLHRRRLRPADRRPHPRARRRFVPATACSSRASAPSVCARSRSADWPGRPLYLPSGDPAPRLALARQMGADEVFALGSTTAEERLQAVRERTSGEGVDVVIEAAGSARAVEEGVTLVRDGGRYVIAGHYTDVGPSTINAHQHINRKHLEIRGCWGSEPGISSTRWRSSRRTAMFRGAPSAPARIPWRHSTRRSPTPKPCGSRKRSWIRGRDVARGSGVGAHELTRHGPRNPQPVESESSLSPEPRTANSRIHAPHQNHRHRRSGERESRNARRAR